MTVSQSPITRKPVPKPSPPPPPPSATPIHESFTKTSPNSPVASSPPLTNPPTFVPDEKPKSTLTTTPNPSHHLQRQQIWNKPSTWTKRTRWIVYSTIAVILLIIIIGASVGATRAHGGVNCDAKPYGYGCHCYEEPSEC